MKREFVVGQMCRHEEVLGGNNSGGKGKAGTKNESCLNYELVLHMIVG